MPTQVGVGQPLRPPRTLGLHASVAHRQVQASPVKQVQLPTCSARASPARVTRSCAGEILRLTVKCWLRLVVAHVHACDKRCPALPAQAFCSAVPRCVYKTSRFRATLGAPSRCLHQLVTAATSARGGADHRREAPSCAMTESLAAQTIRADKRQVTQLRRKSIPAEVKGSWV